MRRSISASEVGKSAADTEAERVKTNATISTVHIASGQPHQLRFIVFAPIIDKIPRGAPCGVEVASVKDGAGFCSRLTRRVAFRGYVALAPIAVTGAP
jgi:hypothetical protein